jgi:chemotaxis protein methyltransferase CheR
LERTVAAPDLHPQLPLITDRMRNHEAFTLFLEKLLPRLGLRTASFRKKRRTVRSRLHRRIDELGLSSYGEYLSYIERNPDENDRLHRMLAITVSRFFRNREDWYRLARRAFPALAALALGDAKETCAGDRAPAVRAASIGCASGEEPYSLVVAWKEWGIPGIALKVLALDLEETCLDRAREGVYPLSSFRSMPEGLLERYFEPAAGEPEHYSALPPVREPVEAAAFDYANDPWPGGLHLLLVRHAAFFYLTETGCRRALEQAAASLVPGGWLFIGSNECLPPWQGEWTREGRNLYRRK